MVTEFKEQLKEFRESLSLGSKSVRNTSSNSSSNSKHHVRKEIREMEEVPFTER